MVARGRPEPWDKGGGKSGTGAGGREGHGWGGEGSSGCPARRPPGTHADNGGDEQQHQHRDVEDDDTQQQEEHCGGKLGSAEFLPARKESRGWT